MVLVFSLAIATSAEATALPATISQNTTLTVAGSPYTGQTTIQPGVTLNVEPGVHFAPSSGLALKVEGTLNADGTAEAPIVFISTANRRTIAFEPGSSASILDHVEMTKGGGARCCGTPSEPVVTIKKASPTIINSTFRESNFTAIEVTEGGSPEIANNDFLKGSILTGATAIRFNVLNVAGDVNIHDNFIEGGSSGITVSAGAAVTGTSLAGNTIIGTTTATAFRYSGSDIPENVTQNTLVGNSVNLIDVGGTVAASSTWSDGGTKVRLEPVTIPAGVTLTVAPGVHFVPSSGLALKVEGTLNADGTAEDPIVFNSTANRTTIAFESDSGASVLDHVEMTNGGGYRCCSAPSEPAVTIRKASPTVRNSTFRESNFTAIWISEGGSPEIANNDFLKGSEFGSAAAIRFNVLNVAGDVNIHDNFIEGGSSGITVSAGAAVTGTSLAGNTIFGTKTTAPVNFSGAAIPSNITENTLIGNDANLIEVGGTVAASSTWKDGGTKVRLRTVTIPSGVALDVAPGVEFEPSGTLALKVEGTLNADGTAEDPIVFNSTANRTTIAFEPGSGASTLDHVEMINGGGARCCGTASEPVVTIRKASPTVTNSTFRESNFTAIWISEGGAPEIANNDFLKGSILTGATAIRFNVLNVAGDVNIHDNFIEGGGSGIIVSAGAAVTGTSLAGNTITGTTTGTAFRYSGSDIPENVTQNTLEGNASEDIYVVGTVGHTSTWKLGGSPVRFDGTVVIPANITLTLQPGVYIRSPQMVVHGTLRAEGTQSRPVTLTGAGELAGGEWGGIKLEPGSGASLLNYVNVGFGGSGTPMLTVNGSSPTITNSAFRRSNGDAIKVEQSGQPTIKGIRFRNNQFGLRYIGEGKLSAPGNDWGCVTGPKPTGCGDSVSANVSWQPAIVLQELPRLCPGTTMPATSNTCLLQKYSPSLRFDSEENYLADNAAQITDNWGDEEGFQHSGGLGGYTNVLLDGSMPISESAPWGFYSMFPLSLSVLGPNYPAAYGGAAADDDDWIDMDNEYVRDAHRMEEAGYANAAYGTVRTDGLGKRWLEYWYWYYYNPKSFAGIGTHEGDWESVLIGLDSNNRPLEVIFSQHESPSNCYVGDVELNEEGGPVVYVALDSHANYRKAGAFDGGVVTDYVDGGGPLLQPGLVILGSSPPSWVSWPGHWGNSRGGGANSTSPDGPAFHGAWSDPAGYAAGADECSENLEDEFGEPFEMRTSGADPVADISAVTFEGRQPKVDYRVPGADGEGFWPRLRISINELGDGGIPPVSRTISNVKGKGKMALPVRVKPGHTAEILGSVVYEDGRRVHLTPRKLK